MRRFRQCLQTFLIVMVFTATIVGQNQTKLGADFSHEGAALGTDCTNLKSLVDCAEDLFTDTPMHVAIGSLSPQNGFAGGLAFVAHYTSLNWRFNLDSDLVASSNKSWRGGVYLKAVPINSYEVIVKNGRPTKPQNAKVSFARPVLYMYFQDNDLKKIDYFGEGPSTVSSGRSFYSMREAIVGGSILWPAIRPESISLIGGVNGRTSGVGASNGQPSPSTGQIYTEATAPGLSHQPGFVEANEGILLHPLLFGGHLQPSYTVTLQEYIAPNDATSSFQRITADLNHDIPLYSTTRPDDPGQRNGPDSCYETVDKDSAHPCPAVSSHNREGTVSVRFLYSASIVPSGHAVPFYLQPTLGGSDLNGNSTLSSFQDYRFRAPNILLIRESIEHSLGKWPLGVFLSVDVGKASLAASNFADGPWRHSFSVGLTLRAGGLPQANIVFAWGGGEGTHVIGNLNSSLLGGGARPSLF